MPQLDNTKPFVPKPRKPGKIQIMFDDNWDLSIYAGRVYGRSAGNVEQNKIFSDRLKYEGYFSQGVNSHIYFRSQSTGRLLHMFMFDFDEAIRSGRFNGDIIEGLFFYVKKGNSQGVRCYFDPQPQP